MLPSTCCHLLPCLGTKTFSPKFRVFTQQVKVFFKANLLNFDVLEQLPKMKTRFNTFDIVCALTELKRFVDSAPIPAETSKLTFCLHFCFRLVGAS